MTQQYARLTDSQWDQVKPYLPIQRKRKYSLRDVSDAILWITRTGCQWRNLDSQFPPWKVVHYYFSKWSRDATLENLNDALNRRDREVQGREPTPSLMLVDAQSVRLLPRIGQDRGMDGGKWINGRKRSILTDTLGRVWRVEVHAANIHDGVAGLDLIYPDFTTQLPRATRLLADSAYTGPFKELMEELDLAVIFECPVRDPKRRGFVVEAKRWVVERTFAWSNWYRRIIKDYELTVENSAAFVLMANMHMVLSSIAIAEAKNF